MEDPAGASPEARVTERSLVAVVAVLLFLAAVPVLWLELVPLAWAAPFVLVYAVVVGPLLLTAGRRRRRLLRAHG